MITRTICAAMATLALSAFANTSSFAQGTSSRIHFTQIEQPKNKVVDSAETFHLQVVINQPEKSEMKFRIAALHPVAKHISVSIRKGRDVIFSDNVAGDQYENLLDLTQLEDGNYEIVVSSGKEKISKTLNIHTETRIDKEVSLN